MSCHESLPPDLHIPWCSACDLLRVTSFDIYSYCVDLSNVKKSAQTGKCQVCGMLWNSKMEIEAFSKEPVVQIDICEGGHGGVGNFKTLTIRVEEIDENISFYEFYRIDGFGDSSLPTPLDLISLKPHISGDTASNESMLWARQKLKDCTEGHEVCRAQAQKSVTLPKRVLDLGDPRDQGDCNDDLRLYETNNEHSPYFCLSHCWGTSLPIRTTKSTLEEFQIKLFWSSLPKTYQDAVVFTRRMGVRYLWIDSLCIVQDDEEDWEKESARMSVIYRESTLVLSATMSADNRGGCFSTAETRKWRHQLYFNVGGHSLDIYLRKYIPYQGYFNRNRPLIFKRELADQPAPLFKRAWAFQERILAPRVLYFLSGELVWECIEQIACESSTEVHGLAKKLDNRDQEANGDSRWRQWVTEYSGLDITIPSDRLPAISGLAAHLNRIHQGTLGPYCAGLWRRSLPEDLLWAVRDPEHRKSRPREWRAPTWSWASVDSRTSYHNRTSYLSQEGLEPCIDVIEAQCTPKGLDPFGQVSAGHLLLSGLLIEVSLRHSTDEAVEEDPYHPSWVTDQRFGIGLFGMRNRRFRGVRMDTAIEAASGWSNVEPGILQYEDTVYYLEIGTLPSGYLNVRNTYGLVLKAVAEQEHTYERIGVASIVNRTDLGLQNVLEKSAIKII